MIMNTSFYQSLRATCTLSSTAASCGLWMSYMYDWCHLKYLGVGERGGSMSRADHLQWWSRLGGGTAAASSEYADCLTVEKRE